MLRLVAMAAALLGTAGAPAQVPARATEQVAASQPTQAMPPRGDTAPVDYARATNWICRPGVDDGTCSANLDAVKVDGAGTRTPAPFVAARDAPIDCFYVYPTASGDPTLYSGLVADAAVKRAVHAQAARLTARCRLFVPAYHQLTIAALHWALGQHSTQSERAAFDFDIPYRDIKAAWLHYLAHDNRGRGVVLVGHSQGAILLKRLIAEQIDGRPAQKRLVAAYLAGNTDLNAGTFHHIPPCARPDQTGCLVAWSSYSDAYAGARFFGSAAGGAAPLCVNPAAVSGGRGSLDAFLSRPAMAPESDPPYVEAVGQMSAECVADASGAVLRVRIEQGRYADLLAAALNHSTSLPTWGLHTLDINLVQGNVLDLIGRQSDAWIRNRR